MSLKPLQAGREPLGQFDGLDSELTSLKGGEVVTFSSVALTSSDLAASDAFDGYVNPSSTQKRTVVTKTLSTGKRPLMLADEGTTGYGTLFGTLVGGTVGQSVSGTVLGPHTTSGSGKVTCWDKPGLYAVSLDAVASESTTGLQPTNTTLDTGAALYATTAGVLTPLSGDSFEVGLVVARFVEFTTNGSLVTTPKKLVDSSDPKSFSFAVISFNVEG